MKKNIFIIMALLVMAGNISASEGYGITDDGYETPDDQGTYHRDDQGRPICPIQEEEYREAGRERQNLRTAQRRAGDTPSGEPGK